MKVTEIQRFCMRDGPGARTTVFLKGCPLRCAWCHNPEAQKSEAELLFYAKRCIGCGGCVSACPNGCHSLQNEHTIARQDCVSCFSCAKSCPTAALERCGREMSIQEILSVVERDRAFYGARGGITLSGGEPFAQGEATVALLKECKQRGLCTAVETCGYADPEILRAAVPLVDLFLWDLKDTDSRRHRRYTGADPAGILQNLSMVSAMGAKIRLRCILVNGINTVEEHYQAVADIAIGIANLDGVELLPYHTYGGSKAVFLGGTDNGRREWIPIASQLAAATHILEARGIEVRS